MLRDNRYEYLMDLKKNFFLPQMQFCFRASRWCKVFTSAVGQQSKTDSQVLTGEMNE